MNPVNTVNDLIQQLATTLSKQIDDLLVPEIGLSHSQYRVLLALEWNPRAQQKTIAMHLGQTEASVSRQMKLLAESSLITINQNPTNRRMHIIAVTPLGMKQTEAASAIIRRMYDPKHRVLGVARLQHLIQELHDLQTAITL